MWECCRNPGSGNDGLSGPDKYFATHEKRKNIALTRIARHDVLRFVRYTETFPQESYQLVVDIRIVHPLQ
jgi:hypothetical protein